MQQCALIPSFHAAGTRAASAHSRVAAPPTHTTSYIATSSWIHPPGSWLACWPLQVALVEQPTFDYTPTLGQGAAPLLPAIKAWLDK